MAVIETDGGRAMIDAPLRYEVIVASLQQALGANLDKVLLYGSRARGVAMADSDVDLLIVVQTRTRGADDAVRRVVYEVMWANDFQTLISALVIDEVSYYQMLAKGSSFARNLRNDQVVLWTRAA